MGEHKVVFCRDCEQYVDTQKPYFPGSLTHRESWFEEAFRTDWDREYLKRMMVFMDRHTGCNITLLGEYGGFQDEFFKLLREYEEMEFENV